MSFIRKSQVIIILVAVCVFAFGSSAEAKLTREDAHVVWDKVAIAADLTNLTFGIEDEEYPQAHVMSDGSATVTTGLLDLLKTRAELYGVLAQEAGFAKLNHHRDTPSQMAGLEDIFAELEEIFAELEDIFSAIISTFFGSDIAEAANEVGEDLVEAAWSRAKEFEAVSYAVKLMYENKENMTALYSATQRISAFDGEQDMMNFSSYPSYEQLLSHIKKEILKYDPTATFPKHPKPGVK